MDIIEYLDGREQQLLAEIRLLEVRLDEIRLNRDIINGCPAKTDPQVSSDRDQAQP